ncbi:DNA methyltransferase family protein [Ureibacillus thermosphaericus]|uniref:methylase n=1 Tax=Ureibacillus thermosphaericus TaxID=51173 RepID=UPI001E4C53CD|nr:methylase [Ureibacillus thermosphaericus]
MQLSQITNEKIIKSKKRVQNHGEVFTPKRIVNNMLDLPKIQEACLNITSTFLEPAAGEGVFLVEVLKRKLKIVKEKYGGDLTRFENYSLLSLSTLYGIELLEDNAQKCVMNMYQVYYDNYRAIALEHGKNVKSNVLDSAKLIISKNIAQGNFLTKLSASGNPIVFNEWKPLNLRSNSKTIKVQRTEYTLEDILLGRKKESGEQLSTSERIEQLDLFELYGIEGFTISKKNHLKYIPVKITDVYREEMEEVNG